MYSKPMEEDFAEGFRIVLSMKDKLQKHLGTLKKHSNPSLPFSPNPDIKKALQN